MVFTLVLKNKRVLFMWVLWSEGSLSPLVLRKASLPSLVVMQLVTQVTVVVLLGLRLHCS